MKWEETYDIKYYDTNTNDMLGISNTFVLFQETAMRQMKECRPSYEELIEQGKAFILSSMRVELYYPIYPYEKITVKTWADNNNKGFTTLRSYELHRDGELIGEALSTWALVSTTDKRLVKISEVDFSNYVPEAPLTLEKPVKVRIPREVVLSLVGEYTVRYTDIDINHHMNNSKYPDMLYNCLPKPEKKIIKSFAITFANEAKLGNNLKIYVAYTDGKYFMRSVLEDGRTNVEAEFEVENID